MIKRVGLLFSLTGTISVVGEGQLQAALLAIDEINQNTDLNLQPVVRDDKSDPQEAAKQAYSLFTEGKIDVLVGCYMSSVRNSVISALNETGGLLLYPTLYEGEQVHPNIFYLGPVPNQQVEPLLCWAFHNLSSNFVLVGSDYVYPQSTNRQVKRWVENGGGKVLFDSYFPLGCTSFDKFFKILKRLTKSDPSVVVFSTLVGTSVMAFYSEFRRKKLSCPIISPLTSEREIRLMAKEASVGHICSSPYFQTLDSEVNKKFVNAFRQSFGDQPISREMITTYGAIHLLSGAYERSDALAYGSSEVEKVSAALKNLRFSGPQGKMTMDPVTQHLWQWCHIGRINREGALDIIWSSPGPIPPRHDSPRVGITVRSHEKVSNEYEFSPPLGVSSRFLERLSMANVAAKTSCSVLITGETGTGKESLARYIHFSSNRRDKPFVALNCAGLPRDLLESELFGYDEGAFTGARKSGKPGKFELTNGGTLFLDEIGEMPLDLQAHLLRVTETKRVYRVGGTKPIKLDIRFISASNKNLTQEIIDGGSFRRDLFYRLNVFHIHLPRLCERPEDIALLADHFLQKCNSSSGVKKFFTSKALKLLEKYAWPGNVRELANVVERAFYLSQDSNRINPEHLPEHVYSWSTAAGAPARDQGDRGEPAPNHGWELTAGGPCPNGPARLRRLDSSSPSSDRGSKLEEMEEEIIRQTLNKNCFNLSQTARLLGIGRSTLYRKLKKYGVLSPNS
jgi:DNA-binding NtrC family response regulator/ABC-type branched-subunit amino acid transport system substrate-binding protein